jgi:hypothetical protein
MQEVVNVLDALERQGQLKIHCEKCINVMLKWCDLIRHLMSPTVTNALDLAKHYWIGEATRDSLNQVRVACWKDLDTMNAESRHADPRYLAGRAVICVLFPDFPPEEESEGGHMYLCLDFAARAEDHSSEQKQLLLREFADAVSER